MRLRTADISARKLGNETIVLNLATSRYLSITGVGCRVFELLTEERSVDDLVDVIVSEYRVEDALARRDIEAFVGKLRDLQLLS